MSELEDQVRALFDAYGRRSNDALQDPPKEDVDGMVAAFAPYFRRIQPQGGYGRRQ